MSAKATLMAAVATLGLSSVANALPIAAGSQFNITGFERAQPDDGTTTLDMATGFDFTAGAGATPGTPGVLSGANGSGTFTSLGTCAGSCGSIQDILSFRGFTNTLNEVIANLPGGTVSFDLNFPLTILRIAADPSIGQLASLVVSGLGTIHLAGYDATPATFTLTTQGTSMTTFSASVVGTTLTSAPAPVPEPTSLALLGTGLLVSCLARRRQKEA